MRIFALLTVLVVGARADCTDWCKAHNGVATPFPAVHQDTEANSHVCNGNGRINFMDVDGNDYPGARVNPKDAPCGPDIAADKSCPSRKCSYGITCCRAGARFRRSKTVTSKK